VSKLKKKVTKCQKIAETRSQQGFPLCHFWKKSVRKVSEMAKSVRNLSFFTVRTP